MVIVGLSAYAHDSAVALLIDGRIAAMAEEERFDRAKHSGAFPQRALRACLSQAGVAPADVGRIGFFLDPAIVKRRAAALAMEYWPSGALEWARNGRNAGLLEPRLRADLAAAGLVAPFEPVEHHLAHAVSAAQGAGWRDAAIFTADGKGEWTATTLGRVRDGAVTLHEEIRYPHSLGYLYSVVTKFLGFTPWSGEGKVMGLAAYGTPRHRDAIEALCPANADGSSRLDLQYFRHHLGLPWIGPKLEALLGEARPPDSPLEQRHYDLAASLQVVFEERLLALARRLREKSGESRLACAGGVFLNGVANWRIRQDAGFDEVFVHPVSHDAGAALGAGLVAAQRAGEPWSEPFTELFLGVDLGDPDVAALARAAGLCAERVDDPAATAARLIDTGRVIGWVQGRAEIGPRALGARSILADPRRADMKDVVNARVKKREGFRPFAPAVLAEKASEWFAADGLFRYMIVVVPVREAKRAVIPAVVHADGTGRVQTVVAATNPKFHALIRAFEARTGVPVVLNTSFNLRGEPMVQTAADAIDCMRRTELDHCLIGDWHVWKPSA